VLVSTAIDVVQLRLEARDDFLRGRRGIDVRANAAPSAALDDFVASRRECAGIEHRAREKHSARVPATGVGVTGAGQRIHSPAFTISD
jgi:hypothetical protein